MVGSPAQEINADFSSYGRLLIWERVYEHAIYGPWVQKIVGIGVGTFNTLRFNYFLEVGTFTTGAHNNFLHVFVEAGIVGFLIYMVVFIHIIRTLVLRSKKYNDWVARSFLLCTLVLLFSSLTQETFWFNPSYGRFWLQYMFFYLIIFNFRTEPNSPNSSDGYFGIMNFNKT
jgi:O-antigen ligase